MRAGKHDNVMTEPQRKKPGFYAKIAHLNKNN
jgi:hypothetical protein